MRKKIQETRQPREKGHGITMNRGGVPPGEYADKSDSVLNVLVLKHMESIKFQPRC